MFSLKYFKQVDGQDLWVAGMSAIGPYTTPKPEEALRFKTEKEAMRHPAFTHPLCITDIVKAPAITARNDDCDHHDNAANHIEG